MEDENLNIATSRRARAGLNPEPGTDQLRCFREYLSFAKRTTDPENQGFIG